MKKQKNSKWRKKIYIAIRLLLLGSIAINAAILAYATLKNGTIPILEIFDEYFENFELIFWALITLILTYIPEFYIGKHKRLSIPEILEIAIVIFIYAGVFFSVRYDMYYRFFWWDDILHAFAGVIIGLISFLVMYKVNIKYKLNIKPALIAFFAFTIAVTAGVLWEILEFSSDTLFKTAHQKWNLPETEIMLGKPYQGSGLRDTMSDLIVSSIGAFITSMACYLIYKTENKRK